MPDEIRPDRLDALVDGEASTGATESEFADLVSALRQDRPRTPVELRRQVMARAERRAPRRRLSDFLRWPAIGAGLVPVVAAAALMVAVWPVSETPRVQPSTSTASAESDTARKAQAPGVLSQAFGTLEGDQPNATASPERLNATRQRGTGTAADSASSPTARTSTAPTKPKVAERGDRWPVRMYVAVGLGLGAAALLGAVIASWHRRRRVPRAFHGR